MSASHTDVIATAPEQGLLQDGDNNTLDAVDTGVEQTRVCSKGDAPAGHTGEQESAAREMPLQATGKQRICSSDP